MSEFGFEYCAVGPMWCGRRTRRAFKKKKTCWRNGKRWTWSSVRSCESWMLRQFTMSASQVSDQGKPLLSIFAHQLVLRRALDAVHQPPDVQLDLVHTQRQARPPRPRTPTKREANPQ